MKRERNELNLRNAFKSVPEECHRALMGAACSVKEERSMKRASFRAVLIAVVILLATVAVALAAQQLGWVDFYKGYDGVTVPKAGQEILNATQPLTYQVGPMTFTYRQLLADGRIGLSAADIHTTDGSEALYVPDCDDIYDPVDAGDGDTVLERYGLEAGTTWLVAARQLHLPLYRVCALIDVTENCSAGVSMGAALWHETGGLVYYSMPLTEPSAVRDALPVTLYMSVAECDPATGEELNQWTKEEACEIPVPAMLNEKSYGPVRNVLLNGMSLTGVRAEQYVTGVYVFCNMVAPDGMSEETALQAAYGLTFLGSDGKELPGGISLSGDANMDAWPTVVLEKMISAEELPQSIAISDGDAEILVKQQTHSMPME